MLLQIQTGRDNNVLRKKAKLVKEFNKKLKKFTQDLIKTMLDKKGVGLAAPQVGVDLRIIIVNFQLKGKSRPLILVNPKVIFKSNETEIAEEGCLSLPNEFYHIARAVEVFVEFFDERGKRHELNFTGLNARVVQHEVDHLNGVLFIDYLNRP
jgi:peptide deformylase